MIITNCLLIAIGAIILLISITRGKHLLTLMPFVRERQRRHLERYLLLNRLLMIIFFFGYIVVLTAFTFNYTFISMTFVSVIFLLGAVFVFIGIDVQSRLLFEVQSTLKGILPICSKCKKIRIQGGNPKEPKDWKRIEVFISEKSDVAFSHGYCPECLEDIKKEIGSLNGVL